MRDRKGTEEHSRGFQTRGLWTRGGPPPWSPRPPALGALNADTGTAGSVSAGCTAPRSSPFPDARVMKDAEIASFSRTTLRLNRALGHAGGCFPQGHGVPVPCPREVPVTPTPILGILWPRPVVEPQCEPRPPKKTGCPDTGHLGAPRPSEVWGPRRSSGDGGLTARPPSALRRFFLSRSWAFD